MPGLAVPREGLERLHLFRSVDLGAAAPLLRDCPVRTLDRGEVLIAAGRRNEHLYLLLDGALTVHLGSPASEPIVTLDAGEHVGELSLIDRKPTSAFVVAKVPSRVLVVDEAIMWTLVALFHGVSNNLLGTLSKRLRYDNDLIYADREQLRERVEELEREQAALRRSESRYQALYDFNPSMFFTVDAEGTVLSVNHFGAGQLGYRVEDLVGASIWPLHLADDRDAARRLLATCMGARDAVHRCEVRLVRRDGGQLWVRETARAMVDGDGRPTALVVCEDITESHRLSEQLSYQASHDALTGLLNRRVFEQRLERALDTARAERSEHALCYMDLDQFKVINDTCGHVAGDELLRQVSALLRGVVRKRDTLARLGGDEFGVLLEQCSLAQAKRVADAVHRVTEGFRFVWEDKSFGVGISIGLVPIDETGEGVTALLAAADAACYAAKDAGRNRTHVYHRDDAAVARRHREMQWVARLNRAFEEDRFRLDFQPIVPAGAPAGAGPGGREGARYELLLRMIDEDGQTVLPDLFLPAAERYGLAVRLDMWVIRTAFAWLERHPAHLERLHLCAINLSGHSLANDEVAELVVRRLHETRIPPHKICFEVTETAAVAHLFGAIQFLKALRALGCRTALDDFGSGLSSFAYLKHLPVDLLKISGAFVRDAAADDLDLAIVKSISGIGKAIGKEIVAECVETEAVRAKLTQPGLGIDYLQGFAVGRPRPLEDLDPAAEGPSSAAASPGAGRPDGAG